MCPDSAFASISAALVGQCVLESLFYPCRTLTRACACLVFLVTSIILHALSNGQRHALHIDI
jgi:hypothetical protein